MVSIHADDYGYDVAVDERMLKLLRGKKIAGVSVLSTMASKVSLKKLANTTSGRKFPRVALHLNLTEIKNRTGVQGGSASVRLIKLALKIMTGRLSKSAIEKEIERQLNILTRAGIRVTAIDSHQHVHALSPVAEAVVSVARKNKIKYLRSYRDIERYTFIAQMKYRILQVASCISYAVYHRRLGLPVTWRISGDPIAVMSWEGTRMSSRAQRGGVEGSFQPVRWMKKISPRVSLGRNDKIKPVTFITHPFLPFDSNTYYMKFIQRGGDTT